MERILQQLRLVVKNPIIYKVLYIPGGCLGFLPSIVAIFYMTQTTTEQPRFLYGFDDVSKPNNRPLQAVSWSHA